MLKDTMAHIITISHQTSHKTYKSGQEYPCSSNRSISCNGSISNNKKYMVHRYLSIKFSNTKWHGFSHISLASAAIENNIIWAIVLQNIAFMFFQHTIIFPGPDNLQFFCLSLLNSNWRFCLSLLNSIWRCGLRSNWLYDVFKF